MFTLAIATISLVLTLLIGVAYVNLRKRHAAPQS